MITGARRVWGKLTTANKDNKRPRQCEVPDRPWGVGTADGIKGGRWEMGDGSNCSEEHTRYTSSNQSPESQTDEAAVVDRYYATKIV